MFARPSCPYQIDETNVIWRPKARKNHILPLDTVDPSVAGQLGVAHLKTLTEPFTEQWVKTFRETFFASSAKQWCGWTGEGLGTFKSTDTKYIEHLDQLKDTLFTRLTGICKDKRFVIPYFEVQKAGQQLARAILNCKLLNRHMGKPPKVLFPSVEDLFRLFAFFPQVFSATADFRHWFHQLPLPAAVRFLFSVASGEWCGEYKVWPMGFRWSPFVSQTISMLIARLAIINQKWTAESPIPGEQCTPPFWIVRNEVVAVVAFIVFWYDNLLVIAGKAFVRDQLVIQFGKVASSVNAQFKLDENEIFRCRQNEADYIGIRFIRRNPDEVCWHHIKKQHWLAIQTLDRSWRTASMLLGVVIWNWTVAGNTRTSILPAVEIARLIGKAQLISSQWDETAVLSEDDWNTLINAVDVINNQGEQVRIFKRHLRDKVRPTILLASDAMKNKGAVVLISPEGQELAFFTYDFDESLSINYKETDIGRRAVLWALRKFPGSDIRLAVDNTTAAVGLSKTIFTADADLQTKLDEMSVVTKEADSTLTVVQVQGVVMAADERSRGSVSRTSKMKICADFLLAARTMDWFQALRKRKHGSSERQR